MFRVHIFPGVVDLQTLTHDEVSRRRRSQLKYTFWQCWARGTSEGNLIVAYEVRPQTHAAEYSRYSWPCNWYIYPCSTLSKSIFELGTSSRARGILQISVLVICGVGMWEVNVLYIYCLMWNLLGDPHEAGYIYLLPHSSLQAQCSKATTIDTVCVSIEYGWGFLRRLSNY